MVFDHLNKLIVNLESLLFHSWFHCLSNALVVFDKKTHKPLQLVVPNFPMVHVVHRVALMILVLGLLKVSGPSPGPDWTNELCLDHLAFEPVLNHLELVFVFE